MPTRHTMQPARPRVSRVARVLAALGACALLSSCATTDESGPRQYLDEVSAATVTASSGGLVFARARTEYAINARDYLTVVPVDVNRAGAHALYFYCYVWSTIDKPVAAEKPAQFEIVADSRPIPLTPTDASLRSLGFGEPPLPPPARTAWSLVSATSREVLQFLLSAQELSVVATRDGVGERYDLWDDRRDAIEEFLHGGTAGP